MVAEFRATSTQTEDVVFKSTETLVALFANVLASLLDDFSKSWLYVHSLRQLITDAKHSMSYIAHEHFNCIHSFIRSFIRQPDVSRMPSALLLSFFLFLSFSYRNTALSSRGEAG